MNDVKQCPLEQSYLFKTTCTVTSCKYHSSIVGDNCLILSSVIESSDEKSISDSELLQYKFFDTELSENDVSKIRKKSVDRVKTIVQLYNLISNIKDNYYEEEGFPYEEGDNEFISELLQRKPLSIARLGFEPWMFAYFIDEEFVSSVCGPKFKIKSALFLKQREYVDLINTVKSKIGEKTNAN